MRVSFRRWAFSYSRPSQQQPLDGVIPPSTGSPKGGSPARNLLASLLNLVLPDDCRLCGQALQDFTRIPVCATCLAAPQAMVAEHFCAKCRTPFLSEHPLDEDGVCGLCRHGFTDFDAAYCYGAYEGKLRDLIHLLKYQRIEPLAKPLANLLVKALPLDQRFDCIIPMPIHWFRRMSRGFNQAEVIAKPLAAYMSLPMVKALRRTRYRPPQVGLTNAQRRDNVRGVFGVRKAEQVAGLRVLLVDDVFTTGASASACAAALKRAGAKHVSLLTLARVDRRPVMAEFRFNPANSTSVGAA
jgi:ComF family protein